MPSAVASITSRRQSAVWLLARAGRRLGQEARQVVRLGDALAFVRVHERREAAGRQVLGIEAGEREDRVTDGVARDRRR